LVSVHSIHSGIHVLILVSFATEYSAGDPFVPRKVVRVILIVRREELVLDTVALVEGFVAE
jgi:hypothetical protein